MNKQQRTAKRRRGKRRLLNVLKLSRKLSRMAQRGSNEARDEDRIVFYSMLKDFARRIQCMAKQENQHINQH